MHSYSQSVTGMNLCSRHKLPTTRENRQERHTSCHMGHGACHVATPSPRDFERRVLTERVAATWPTQSPRRGTVTTGYIC